MLRVATPCAGTTDVVNPNPRTRRHIITRHLTTAPGKVYSLKDAKRDIRAVYGTGLFEDVTMLPQEAEGSTETHPKVCQHATAVGRGTLRPVGVPPLFMLKEPRLLPTPASRT